MRTKQKSRWILAFAVMVWFVALGAGPAFASGDLPPVDQPGSGGPCNESQKRACSNTKNSENKQCQNIRCTDGEDSHFQCDCLDVWGGTTPGKKKGPR